MYTYRKTYRPYISPFDPCQPMRVKTYETPVQIYLGFQPPGLPQYSPHEALYKGTLWPILYVPYDDTPAWRETDSKPTSEGSEET